MLLVLQRALVPRLLDALLVEQTSLHLPLLREKFRLVLPPILLPPVLHDQALLLAVRHVPTLTHGRLSGKYTSSATALNLLTKLQRAATSRPSFCH